MSHISIEHRDNMVQQEQIIRLLFKFGGFSLSDLIIDMKLRFWEQLQIFVHVKAL